MQAAYELNYPLCVAESDGAALAAKQGVRPPSHSFLSLAMHIPGRPKLQGAAAGVILTALKPAEDGPGWVLRLHETFGRKGTVWLTFDRPVVAARRVDSLERPAGELRFEGSRVALPIGPYRIESLHVRLRL